VSQPTETSSALSALLLDIPVRVAAELGRVTLPLALAVDLGPGAVVELDLGAEDPVDLCVNGQPFATGQLLLIDETEWAVRIDRLLDVNLLGGGGGGGGAAD
jgi:flagellar motor switch protein FliN/FliY